MSATISIYKTLKEGCSDAKDMTLTAAVGGDKYGHTIQFTIGNEYAVLSEEQLLDLISVISRRLLGREGYTATGCDSRRTVSNSGEVFSGFFE